MIDLGLQDLALFSLTVLVLNATPGVDLLLTVSRTLQAGPRAGVAAALGINAGCVVHALAAAFGLAALISLLPLPWKKIGAVSLVASISAAPTHTRTRKPALRSQT